MNDWIDLHALAKIVVVGVICGAGLPAVFALGLRALHLGEPAVPSAGGVTTDHAVAAKPAGISIAAVCFAVVLAGIAWGIYWIVSS